MSDESRIVKQLDHLVVRADDPQPLFKLLSETLKLPVACVSCRQPRTRFKRSS